MAFAAMAHLGSVTANTRTKTDEVLTALQTAQGKSLTHTWTSWCFRTEPLAT